MDFNVLNPLNRRSCGTGHLKLNFWWHSPFKIKVSGHSPFKLPSHGRTCIAWSARLSVCYICAMVVLHEALINRQIKYSQPNRLGKNRSGRKLRGFDHQQELGKKNFFLFTIINYHTFKSVLNFVLNNVEGT